MSPSRINEVLESSRHRIYFSEHVHDPHFPLDGSDWARLVAMRLARENHHHVSCECHSCADFWAWLHSETGPLLHERKSFQKAAHHWFLIGSDIYGLPWYHNGEKTSSDLAWQTLNDFVKSKRTSDLSQTEAEWVKARTSAKVWGPNSGQHWLGSDSEEWESRSQPNLRTGLKPGDFDGSSDSLIEKGQIALARTSGRMQKIGDNTLVETLLHSLESRRSASDKENIQDDNNIDAKIVTELESSGACKTKTPSELPGDA